MMAIYFIESLVIKNQMPTLSFVLLSSTFLFVMIIRSIAIPLEFRFGYMLTKYILIIVVFAVSFGGSLILKTIGMESITATLSNILKYISAEIISVCAIIIGIIAIVISLFISKKIMSDKEY